MSYEANDKELAAVWGLAAPERYGYFVEKVADWEELWSVGTEDQWALIGDNDGRELVPVWPAKAFASICCVGNWIGYRPRRIAIDDWLEKWTPGMIAEHRLVAVCPDSNWKGMVVTPAKLHEDLTDAIEQYE